MTTESVRYIQLDRLVLVGDDTSFIRVIGRQPALEGALCYMGARIAGFTRAYAAQMEQTRAQQLDRPFPPPRLFRYLSWEEVKRLHGFTADPTDWPEDRPRVNLKPAQEEV